MPDHKPQQSNQKKGVSPEKMYLAALQLFETAGYTKVESIGVSPEVKQATAFKNPTNDQLYIVYRPSDSEDNDFISDCNEAFYKKLGNDKKIQILGAKRVYLTVNKNQLYSLCIDGIDPELGKYVRDFEIEKQQPHVVLKNIRRIINEKHNQSTELGFFDQRPWIKDVAIGVGVGLAIVGAVAAVVLTAGAATIPAILGFGAAASFGSSAIIGLAAIGTAFVTGCAAVAFGFGKLLDRKISQGTLQSKTFSYFDKQYVENLKKQTETKRAEFTSNEIIYKQILDRINSYNPPQSKINATIEFITKEMRFFTAPFYNQELFAQWVKTNRYGEEISRRLNRCLVVPLHDPKDNMNYAVRAYEFRDALFESQNTNSKEPLVNFLKDNTSVVRQIDIMLDVKEYQDAISDWYKFFQQNEAKIVKITKNNPEKAPQHSSDELSVLDVKTLSRKS